MTAARILIVDDHPLTREALAGLLAHNGFDVCGQAAGGEEAIRLAAELQPDLALLDLTMPGLHGLQTLPRLREAAPGCAVVVLTAAEDEENLVGAIRAGAAGYLLKSEPPERIVSFLRGVGEGEVPLSGAVAPRRDPELGEHALHVRPHRVLRDLELARDLVGREVPLEQEEHLGLARGEDRGDRGGHRRRRLAFSYLLEQSPRDRA